MRGIKGLFGSGAVVPNPLRLPAMAGTAPQNFRRCLLRYQDPSFMQNAEMWLGFLKQLTESYESDLVEVQNMVTPVVKNDWSKGINAKDLKPHKFDSNVKSSQSYKQFAQDTTAWMKKIDKSLAGMLKATSQLEEWNGAKYVEVVKQDLGLHEDKIKELDEGMADLLRNITEGDAR